MFESEPVVTIVAPGILGPVSGSGALPQALFSDLPDFFSGASKISDQPADYYQQLAALLGWSRMPVASLLSYYDQKKNDVVCSHDKRSVIMEPVHLRVDRDSAVLIDQYYCGLDTHDAESLVSLLKQNFPELASLKKLTENQWLWHCEYTDFITTPIDEVIGKDIRRFDPAGRHAAKIRSLLNEIQMLLHDCDVNQKKEAKSQLSINSVWMWGEGDLLQVNKFGYTRIAGKGKLLEALACYLNIEFVELDEYIKSISESSTSTGNDKTLLVLTGAKQSAIYGELETWAHEVKRLVTHYIKPVIKQTRSVAIYPCNGRAYLYRYFQKYKFWIKNNYRQNVVEYKPA